MKGSEMTCPLCGKSVDEDSPFYANLYDELNGVAVSICCLPLPAHTSFDLQTDVKND